MTQMHTETSWIKKPVESSSKRSKSSWKLFAFQEEDTASFLGFFKEEEFKKNIDAVVFFYSPLWCHFWMTLLSGGLNPRPGYSATTVIYYLAKENKCMNLFLFLKSDFFWPDKNKNMLFLVSLVYNTQFTTRETKTNGACLLLLLRLSTNYKLLLWHYYIRMALFPLEASSFRSERKGCK